MKQLIFIVLIILTGSLYSQNIVAGQFGAEDYYFDFVPDSVLSAVGGGTQSMTLDINADNTDDVLIETIYLDQGQWGYYRKAKITSLNGAEVSLGQTDTCFANNPPTLVVSIEKNAMAMDSLDVIDISHNWFDSTLYLNFDWYSASTPNGAGHGCQGGEFYSIYRYAGIRVFNQSDTLYGWIKLRYSGLNIEVDSYACNVNNVGINELTTDSEKHLLKITDLMGRETEDVPNTPLIYIYSDGTTEKVFKVE